jgi:uncharacterized protein
MAAGTSRFDWDEEKREINLRKHKIDFTAAYEFDWDTAVILIDDREDYGELREIALGFIGVNLCSIAFTRGDGVIRIISLRKAHNKEKRLYVQATQR